MSIRLKVLGAILVTFLALFITIFAISQSVLLNSFAQLEQKSALENITRVQNVLQDNVTAQLSTNADWAIWTDTYEFMQGNYPEYPDDNLSTEAIITLNLNMMLFVTNDGELYASKIIDLETGEDIDLPAGFESYFTDADLLISDADFESNNGGVGGFLHTADGQLVLVTARAILMSDGAGPVGGTLVMGRFIDTTQIAALSQSLQLDIQIYPYAADDLPANVNSAKSVLSVTSPTVIEVLDDDTIVGYAQMQDITGQPISIVTATLPRDIYAQGQQTVSLLALLLVLTGSVLSVVMVIALEWVVIRRMTRLANEVNTIQEGADTSRRVTVVSSDEVTDLSQNINAMLERISQSQQQLESNNAALKVAYEHAEEATRLKSQFLSTMSHELRTPLNAVIGYAGIILEGIGGEIDDDARDMVTHIYDGGVHLLNLINDVLDISKIEAGRLELVPEPFSVRLLASNLKEQMEILAIKKNIGFHVTIADNVPSVLHGDKDRIAQIIINLLSNAFKFTDKGQVDLTFAWQDAVIIKVRDTGKGIAPTALEYIFEEFRQESENTQRTHGGTGLGLAICRKLAELMGGTITVASILGEGTTFAVHLPLKPVQNVAQDEMEELA
jgi:signal transduction histidine kinase